MGHMCMAKHKLMHQKQLKEVGSSHKDTPDMLLPAHALSGPTARMSQVYQEPPTIVPLCVAPFIPKGHMTHCTCTCDDVISDVIMSQDNATLQLAKMT